MFFKAKKRFTPEQHQVAAAIVLSIVSIGIQSVDQTVREEITSKVGASLEIVGITEKEIDYWGKLTQDAIRTYVTDNQTPTERSPGGYL